MSDAQIENTQYFDLVELAQSQASALTAEQSFKLEVVMDDRQGSRLATRRYKRMKRWADARGLEFDWDKFMEFIEFIFELLAKYGILSADNDRLA